MWFVNTLQGDILWINKYDKENDEVCQDVNILVLFHSNDDDLRKHKWPRFVSFVPKPGDVVESKQGRFANVGRITHRFGCPKIELSPIK